MCAVIGVDIQSPTPDDIELIRNLFRESRIRGKHATGVSLLRAGTITTIISPISADLFVEQHDPVHWVYDNRITFIGHCRYSTSDIEYNQPIADCDLSVVHNGVISQELPENWESLYGIQCEGKNDTELLFHTLKQGKDPFEVWGESSISAIWLTSDTGMRYNRNGKRPLWAYESEGRVIVTSTKDIAKRAGLIHEPTRVEIEGRDLQPAL
jgi:glutamine phosphoribosylpyrophosphate amidotransferase